MGLGKQVRLRQHGISISGAGVLRGIHYAAGQEKYVTCMRGTAFDVIVDLRVDSPTFGRWDAILLDEKDRRSIFLSDGLGHGFLALEDGTTMNYLLSLPYDPATEREVHPLDVDLGIAWPSGIGPVLSERDAAAPTMRVASERGLLPAIRSVTVP